MILAAKKRVSISFLTATEYYFSLIGKLKLNVAPLPSELFSAHENEVESEMEKATRLSLLRHNNSNDDVFIYVIAGVISMANMF